MPINRIRLRRGTAADWVAANPVLASGEPGVELDTGKQKIGDGVKTWTALPYTATTGAPGPEGPPNTDASLLSSGTVPDGRLPGRLDAAALSATYGRGSIYLKDYLTAGATAAANRTAYQAAVTAASTAGKPLCYDGATFTFEGTAVTDTRAGAVHWATGWDTHKVTNQTRGRGVLRLEGAGAQSVNMNVDGANPTLDFTTADASLFHGGAFQHSTGVALVGAHGGVIRNLRAAGFFHATQVTAIPPEVLATGSGFDVYPLLENVTVDGVYNDGCWTACKPIGFRNMTIRRLTGWYQASISSGGEPHQLYGEWRSPTTYSEGLYVSDCSTFGGSQRGTDPAGAYKIRGARGVKFTNLIAENCPGLLDMEYVEDFEVSGLASRKDINTNTLAIRWKDCKRGTVEPITLDSVATLTETAVLLAIANSTGVKVKEPRLSFTNNAVLTNMSVITVNGTCTGSEVSRPRVTNKGTANVQHAVSVNEASGSTGSVSGALIDDPEVSGPVNAGVRLTLPGAKVKYSPARLTMVTSKVRVEPAATSYSIVNTTLPNTPPRTIGWHGGEVLGDTAIGSAHFPSGQQAIYRFGNNWAGSWGGRITETSSGGRRIFVANFGSADTDVQADVLLGPATRAGLCLRASGDSTYLTVSRASGAVKIHKMAAGTITELATVATSIPNGMFATLRAMVVGNVVVAFLNGVQVLTHTLTGGDETAYVAVNHGLYGDTAAAAAWESVIVRTTT